MSLADVFVWPEYSLALVRLLPLLLYIISLNTASFCGSTLSLLWKRWSNTFCRYFFVLQNLLWFYVDLSPSLLYQFSHHKYEILNTSSSLHVLLNLNIFHERVAYWHIFFLVNLFLISEIHMSLHNPCIGTSSVSDQNNFLGLPINLLTYWKIIPLDIHHTKLPYSSSNQ